MIIFRFILLFFIIFPGPAISGDLSNTYKNFKIFGEVFDRIREDYVESVQDQDLIESAINGMLTSLDPHSGYLNEKDYSYIQTQTKGEFGGLGIEVTMEDGLVKVISPIDETPAARAGIKSGDLVTHLNGEPVLGLTLNEAVDLMRGPVNTEIVLTVRRNKNEIIEVTIIRAIIKVKSVYSRVEKNIGYLRITTFNEQASVGLVREMDSLMKNTQGNLQGIVLDLRNNPGGLLEQAIQISDAFLTNGEIVSTQGRDGKDTKRFSAKSGDITGGMPMVVLINQGTASASEIVAGALQDHKRAIILGTRSFGKGSVQTIIPVGTQGAMRLTTALYYTPSGRSIQATGIDPDIYTEQLELKETDQKGNSRLEKDLRGALENTQSDAVDDSVDVGRDSNVPNLDAQESKTLAKDYQLSRAVDLLNSLSIYQQQNIN